MNSLSMQRIFHLKFKRTILILCCLNNSFPQQTAKCEQQEIMLFGYRKFAKILGAGTFNFFKTSIFPGVPHPGFSILVRLKKTTLPQRAAEKLLNNKRWYLKN